MHDLNKIKLISKIDVRYYTLDIESVLLYLNEFSKNSFSNAANKKKRFPENKYINTKIPKVYFKMSRLAFNFRFKNHKTANCNNL